MDKNAKGNRIIIMNYYNSRNVGADDDVDAQKNKEEAC